MEEKHIELIARGVIVHEGNILLCKSDDYYYLPGGHIEFSEDGVFALKREIEEEANITLKSARFIGVVENVFGQNGEHKHEINLVFEAHVASPEIHITEENMDISWVPLEEFKKGRALPGTLKEKVLQWMEDKQVFFGSEKI